MVSHIEHLEVVLLGLGWASIKIDFELCPWPYTSAHYKICKNTNITMVMCICWCTLPG